MPATTRAMSMASVTDAVKPKRIDNNTYRYTRSDGTIVIRLHLTDIIETLPDGRIKLNSGGWKTVTTKDRLNKYTPYRVYSDKGVWYVHRNGDKAPFVDGMLLPDAFNGPALAAAAQEAADAKKLKADIAKFVLKTLPSGKPIPVPGTGDCWYCLMFDKEEAVDHASTGWRGPVKPVKAQHDTGHLRSHIEEGYMNGSLVVNAMRDNGLTDVGISIIAFSSRPDHVRVRRIVRRYLQKRLGLTY